MELGLRQKSGGLGRRMVRKATSLTVESFQLAATIAGDRQGRVRKAADIGAEKLAGWTGVSTLPDRTNDSIPSIRVADATPGDVEVVSDRIRALEFRTGALVLATERLRRVIQYRDQIRDQKASSILSGWSLGTIAGAFVAIGFAEVQLAVLGVLLACIASWVGLLLGSASACVQDIEAERCVREFCEESIRESGLQDSRAGASEGESQEHSLWSSTTSPEFREAVIVVGTVLQRAVVWATSSWSSSWRPHQKQSAEPDRNAQRGQL